MKSTGRRRSKQSELDEHIEPVASCPDKTQQEILDHKEDHKIVHFQNP
jgi:hypothetical protein